MFMKISGGRADNQGNWCAAETQSQRTRCSGLVEVHWRYTAAGTPVVQWVNMIHWWYTGYTGYTGGTLEVHWVHWWYTVEKSRNAITAATKYANSTNYVAGTLVVQHITRNLINGTRILCRNKH